MAPTDRQRLGRQARGPPWLSAAPFDLADASVAEAAARLKIGAVLTIDADFDVYRDRTG